MPQFTRPTIVAAVRIVASWYHSSIDSFLLEHGLESFAPKGANSTETRANLLTRYLLDNPDASTGDGENLTDTIVRALVQGAATVALKRREYDPAAPDFSEQFPKLARALTRDSFTVQDGQLRSALPTIPGLPAADDEVHELLKRFGFVTPIGHLDQAIQSHTDGRWAVANSQMRSFIEGLLDEIAEKLAPQSSPLPPRGAARLTWLAKIAPPFVLAPLNEWDGQGKGFLEAFFRRLHPAGSHPGLSDEDDSTFRLQIVLVVGRLLLRRLAERLGS